MRKIAADRNYRMIKEAKILDLDADGNLIPVLVQQNIASLWDRINWLESKLLRTPSPLVTRQEVRDTTP